MTLYEFSRLDDTEQLEAFREGALVGERRDGDYDVECRQVDAFYVEYHILGGHYLSMNSFKTTDRLQPYLDRIDISALSV